MDEKITKIFSRVKNPDDGVGDSRARGQCRQVFVGMRGGIDDYGFKDGRAIDLIAQKLKKFPSIKYVLGRHDLADFQNKDMVIKAAGVPLDSPYITEARKNNIKVEMDASLFVSLVGHSVSNINVSTWTLNVQVVGITGTRGKSTVTHLIYEILKASGRRVFLGGNVRGLATLPLLKKVKPDDIVVMELDSWQLQGFEEAKIKSEHSRFYHFLPDHQNYYKNDMDKYFSDKANIYRWQKKGDWFIAGPTNR